MNTSPHQGAFGIQGPEAIGGEINAQTILIRTMLGKVSTATLVQVQSVTNAGDLSPVGFVDVQPMVNQTDGAGNAVPHLPLHRLPYFRLQGGADAVILDPKPGDIGIAVFADHDISRVKATKAQGNPGSRRRFNMADGLYIGGVLNGTPTQYVQFSAAGITVVSPTKVTVQAPETDIIGDKVVIHATTSLHIDCDGNGFVYGPTTRDDYSIGTTGATHDIDPPQVP